MPEFEKKTVLITGGTKGIGKGIAKAYLKAGAYVYVCARNEPDNLPCFEENQASFFQADIRDEQQIQNIIDRVTELTGRLDILINNAGGSPEVEVAKTSSRFSQAIIELNLIAPLIFAQKAYAVMSKNGGGSIVNIASISGTRPSPGTAAYGAAKAGLINLTSSLAQEWGPDVRINAIIAGLMQTEAAEDHYEGNEGINYIAEYLPLKRFGHSADIANACLYLTSSAAGYVSGAALEVTGGGEPPIHYVLARQARTSKEQPR